MTPNYRIPCSTFLGCKYRSTAKKFRQRFPKTPLAKDFVTRDAVTA